MNSKHDHTIDRSIKNETITTAPDYTKTISHVSLEDILESFNGKVLADHIKKNDRVVIKDGSYAYKLVNGELTDFHGIDARLLKLGITHFIIYKVIEISKVGLPTRLIGYDTAAPINNIVVEDEFGNRVYTNHKNCIRINFNDTSY